MASYLQKRRRRWYAVMEIPKALRPRFGKVRFVQSLGTESRTVAEREVHAIVAAWNEQLADEQWPTIDFSVRGKTYSREVPHPVVLFQKLRNAATEEERQAILEEISSAAWHIGSINVENIGDRPSSAPEAQRYHARATGGLVSFTEHLDEWLSTSRATAKTQDMQRSDVMRFAAKFAMVQDVTRPEVRRWITELMNDGGSYPQDRPAHPERAARLLEVSTEHRGSG